jgi:hypothetical protein
LEDRLAGGADFAVGVVLPEHVAVVRDGGLRAALAAASALGAAVGEVVERHPGTVAAHGTDGTVHVVTEPDRGPALEAELRAALRSRPAVPAVRTAWLRYDHRRGNTAVQLAGELLALAGDTPPPPVPAPRRSPEN